MNVLPILISGNGSVIAVGDAGLVVAAVVLFDVGALLTGIGATLVGRFGGIRFVGAEAITGEIETGFLGTITGGAF